MNLDKNCSSETARVKRSFGHEMDGMRNISNGTGKNVEPRNGIKNVLDDYLELKEVVDLVSGLSSSSLVGLDMPPNFMKCNEAKIKLTAKKCSSFLKPIDFSAGKLISL